MLVDFTATWCGPCQRIAPKFAELADKATKISLVKVDVDENEEAAQAAGVNCMPTFQVWKDGKMVEKFEGASPEKLEDLFNKYEAM